MNRIVFDLEGDSLYPTKIWCIVAKELDGKRRQFIWIHDYDIPLEEWLDTVLGHADEIIGHNIINFDLPVISRLTGWSPPYTTKVTDTLVQSRLSLPDREGGHSLRAWGERLGFPKGEFEDWTGFSKQMLEYCMQDVDVTEQLVYALEREMQGHDWSESLAIEHNIARIITEQEINGFYFDSRGAQHLLRELDSAINSIAERLSYPVVNAIVPGPEVLSPYRMDGKLSVAVVKHYGNSEYSDLYDLIAGPFCKLKIEEFNPGSTHHMKKWLLSIGWEPDEHTPGGQPKLTNSSLMKLGEVGKALIDRGVMSHRLNQVKGLLERMREDGRVSAGANPCGTPTGRMRHSGVVNIPKAADHIPYGKEIRSLFTVPNDMVLVGYDAKGLELRILAHYIGDKNYSEVIVNGDPHVFAQQAAGLPSRDAAKTFNYAFIYGAGFGKLGALVGGGYEDGKRIAERMYRAIPGLRRLVDGVGKAAKRGYLIGLDGRKLWLRDEHKGLNTLIQSAGAICMKKIAVLLDGKVDKRYCKKVCDMHDEAQWEVHPSYVDTFTELVHQCFVEVTEHFDLKCKLEADVKTGRNWAMTH